MKCFYHNADMDGYCSAAIVHQKYPEAELIGINYGYPFPWDSIMPKEEVWLVDFSLQPFSDMLKLFKMAKVTWIDHHKSAIEQVEGTCVGGVDFAGHLEVGLGACAWVWDYCFPTTGPRPRAIQLLAEYDVWDHSDPDTLPFEYGIRATNLADNPTNPMWEALFDGDGISEIISEGEAILRYIDKDNAIKARSLCFDHELPTPITLIGQPPLRCLAANFGPSNSKLFESVWDPNTYDAMLMFSWRKRHWTISLYSDREDVDVSVVAKAYGGGGHKGAAGFQVKTLSEIGLTV